ncbi:hypothetical protein ES705_04923 [subsurface metagenome]
MLEVVKLCIINFEDANEIISISESSNFYNYLSRKAWELGYITKNDELSHLNIIKCDEQIWKYVEEGILAPGSVKKGKGRFNYYFFPFLHLTEKGKKEMKSSK